MTAQSRPTQDDIKNLSELFNYMYLKCYKGKTKQV